MKQIERIYLIDRMLRTSHGAVSRARIKRELVCSTATITRDIAFMRDRLELPIYFDRDLKGYKYGDEDKPILPGADTVARKGISILTEEIV